MSGSGGTAIQNPQHQHSRLRLRPSLNLCPSDVRYTLGLVNTKRPPTLYKKPPVLAQNVPKPPKCTRKPPGWFFGTLGGGVVRGVVLVHFWGFMVHLGRVCGTFWGVSWYPPPPLSFPTPGKTVPHHPLGDGHQVTVPHPPLGEHTPRAGRGGEGARGSERRRTDTQSCSHASPCSECPTSCAKTGSPVERMNITLVPGGNMVVLSSSISAKVSKMSCHECKGCKW